jgi:hypothetical protein
MLYNPVMCKPTRHVNIILILIVTRPIVFKHPFVFFPAYTPIPSYPAFPNAFDGQTARLETK